MKVEVDGRELTLTNLDRVLWPTPRFTKGDLVDYYTRVAPAILPHLAGRPLSMVRLPHGVTGRLFLQNECRGAPDWMATAELTLRTGETRRYCVVNDAASLVWVANLGTVELHPYAAPAERPDEPPALLLDLDPGPGTTFADVCRVALALRRLAAERGLVPLPKTSGGAGLHLYARLHAGTNFETARTLGRALAAATTRELPDLIAPPDARARQADRVLVDWLQNDPRRSTIAPYSLRVDRAPGVSTPLLWSEVEAATSPLRFNPRAVLRRIDEHGDLFAAAARE